MILNIHSIVRYHSFDVLVDNFAQFSGLVKLAYELCNGNHFEGGVQKMNLNQCSLRLY